MLKGYSSGKTGTSEFKRMAWTVENNGGNYYVRNYELIPGKDTTS